MIFERVGRLIRGMVTARRGESTTSPLSRVRFPRVKNWVVLAIVGFFLMGWAVAQTSGGTGGTTPDPSTAATQMPGGALNVLLKSVSTVESGIKSLETNGGLAQEGIRLLAVLGTVVITWNVIKNMMLKPGLPQLVADLVFPTIVIGLGLSAINGGFAGVVRSSIDGIGKALGAGDMTAVSFAGNMLTTIQSFWGALPESSLFDISISKVMAMLIGLLVIVIIVAATALGLAMLFAAKFQVALAIALAPIMIPWLIWRPTEFLFNGWLSFLLKGCFISVAVFVIQAVMGTSLVAFANMAKGWSNQTDAMLAWAALAILALLFGLLMAQAAQIGSGIIGGAAVGLGSGAVVAGAAGGVMGGAASALRGGANFGVGRMQAGKTDAQLSPLAKSLQPRPQTGQRLMYELGRKAPAGSGAPPRTPPAAVPGAGPQTGSSPGTSGPAGTTTP